jgi:hypothetical protein
MWDATPAPGQTSFDETPMASRTPGAETPHHSATPSNKRNRWDEVSQFLIYFYSTNHLYFLLIRLHALNEVSFSYKI